MINLRKAQIFVKYGGNIDLWLRDASSSERSAFTEGDWSLIESIIDELSILKKFRESPHHSRNLETERTYTTMTEEQYRDATAEAERFVHIVEKSEYEETVHALWKCACLPV